MCIRDRVSFTRGTLLGGLDAPTGGQSQSNPHPVLIRLSDNSVLPNRFRAEYRECFVIAAGYGDISSERAYLRTESLSCVRTDGATLEVKIQGSVYGEDGKVGMRGRLVTKQGQMLANALLAGVVSGIGQGLATSSTEDVYKRQGQVNPVDQWVGTAGRKLAQYENEREEQGRLNKNAQAFEAKTMQRFADLEQRLTSAQQAAATPAAPTLSLIHI